MVSTVQQRRRQVDAGNDGDEANAGAAGVEREAPCFSSADVQAFFAQHEAEQTHLLAKQSQALNFDFREECALHGDWKWENISADGFTPRRPDAAVSPVEDGTAATHPAVVDTPTKCGRGVSNDSDLYTRTPAIKARKRARGDVEPLKLSLTLRSSAKACSP
jgi:hypothetical protein